MDKVRADALECALQSHGIGFPSPWIRFALLRVMLLPRKRKVSIPVDKVRARPLSRERIYVRVSIPVDKVRAWRHDQPPALLGVGFNPRG